jgi:hypothetical protein
MATDPSEMEPKPKCPWYKFRGPRPVAWILYAVLFVWVALILYHFVPAWWAMATLLVNGAKVQHFVKGGYVITLAKDRKAALLLNANLIRLNSLGDSISLEMDDTDVTDDDLVYVEGLEKLADLQLSNTHISDACLPHLAKIHHLWGLKLNGTKVTDEGLAHLEGLTNLYKLHLANTDITDAGIPHLAKLHHLYELNLEGTKVADKGLVHLEGCTNLSYLDLANTNITDAGIPHLAKAYCLTKLNLKGTKVTDEGAMSLRQALPKCWVER